MAADTVFTITQIELALAQYFNYRANLIVPKVSWGLLDHEADLLIMNKTGYLTEVEIKRSWADFLADFRKKHTHDDPKVSWFYYAVPASIASKCLEKLAEVDPMGKWGLLSYDYDRLGECWPTTIKLPSNSTYHQQTKKLSSEEKYQLARLGAMRTWPLKNAIIKYGK